MKKTLKQQRSRIAKKPEYAGIEARVLQHMLSDALEELRDQSIRKLPAGKFIWDYTEAELSAAIDRATKQFGPEFWVLLNGIDAYMERRRRKYTSKRPTNQPWLFQRSGYEL